MEIISGIASCRIKTPVSVSEAEETDKLRQSGEEAQEMTYSFKEMKDEYIPEEQLEPGGRYWPDRGEDGKLKIHYDDPDKSEPDSVKTNKSNPDSKPEICHGSTEKVDREIERLKKEQMELKQKISSESDEMKIKELKSRLEQVERELRQKDNDTYRRQHTVFF